MRLPVLVSRRSLHRGRRRCVGFGGGGLTVLGGAVYPGAVFGPGRNKQLGRLGWQPSDVAERQCRSAANATDRVWLHPGARRGASVVGVTEAQHRGEADFDVRWRPHGEVGRDD